MKRFPSKPPQATDDPDVDPELYDRVYAASTEFLDAHRCSVLSTELPLELLCKWRMPSPEGRAERKRLRKLILSTQEGVLAHLPFDIFAYACEKRFGPADDDQTETRYADAFAAFQVLLACIFFFHVCGKTDLMPAFDLFDLDGYEALYETLPERLAAADPERRRKTHDRIHTCNRRE